MRKTQYVWNKSYYMDYMNTDAWGKSLLLQLLSYADVAKFLL